MLETGRRAYEARALHRGRVDWNTYIPDEREGFTSDQLDTLEPTWFKAKGALGFQHPSVVLVEDVVRRNDAGGQGQGRVEAVDANEGCQLNAGLGQKGRNDGPAASRPSFMIRKLELDAGKDG